MTVFEDNTAAITQCTKTTTRGKLNEQKYLKKQELFEKKILKTEKIGTKDQKADICTKPLSATRFKELIDMLF